MTIRVIPAILLAQLLCHSDSLYAASAALSLVRDGASSYSICISTNAPAPERRAAEELQRFLQEISGARLPIVTDEESRRDNVILVGKSAAPRLAAVGITLASLGPEGFVLKIAAHTLIIAGGSPRGTLYGVYTFLEILGCRWFTRDVARIPKRRTIEVRPLDRIERPAFEYREPFFTEAFDRDWAARNKMNGAHMLLDDSTGGKVQYFPFVHTFYQLVAPEKYFKDHPEYFSLIGGKRTVERGQLCLTNPDVLRVAVETVRGWIRDHPEATLYSVSQNDWEGWCECDRCRKVEEEEGGAHSGPILRFVNALAAEIEKTHPEKLIDTLAYWYSEPPPTVTRPLRNVRIRLCPINACEAHPYEKCPYNAEFMQNLRGWSRITDQLYIWHYVTNFSHYLLPFPDFDEIAADIPMYHRHGVVGLFMEGAYPRGGGGENAELRSYVMARLLWNPRADVERAIDEFLEGCFGKAARPMRAYFDLLHRQVRFPPRGSGQHIWIRRSPDLSDAVVRRARSLFQQAESLAESDAVRDRVLKARLSLDYYELMRARTYRLRDSAYEPAEPDGLEQRFRKFFTELRRFGITSIHEGIDLEEDERQLPAAVQSFSTVPLESPTLRVQVVPNLSARVVRILDKKSGVDLLRPADLGGQVAGLGTSLSSEVGARIPIDTRWRVAAGAGTAELVLRGTTDNGLELTRTLKLLPDAPVLRLETLAENKAATDVSVAIQSRFDFNPGPKTDPAVLLSFVSTGGTKKEKHILGPGLHSGGTESFSGANLPDGEWSLTNQSLGVTVTNRFTRDLADRCVLGYRARGENRASLTVWSLQKNLPPGSSMRFSTEYRITR